jgi:hypothetical protein
MGLDPAAGTNTYVCHTYLWLPWPSAAAAIVSDGLIELIGAHSSKSCMWVTQLATNSRAMCSWCGAGWHLDHVEVIDDVTGTESYFPCNKVMACTCSANLPFNAITSMPTANPLTVLHV